MQDSTLQYALIAVGIGVLLLFGVFVLGKIQRGLCAADIASFRMELESLNSGLKPGDASLKEVHVPCGADRVYFLDSNSPLKDHVSDNRFLADAIESDLPQDIFLIKKDTLLASIDGGELSVDYPSFLCLSPKSEKMEFYVESRENKAWVFPACGQEECAYITQPQYGQKAIEILLEALAHGRQDTCVNCPKNASKAYGEFIQTRENMDLSRKYHYCRETGITTVEIKLTPKAKFENITLYESIPKECIDDLNEYLVSNLGDSVDIKADPLIVWKFDTLSSEQAISYAIRAFLSDNCKRSMAAMAAASGIKEGIQVEVPYINIEGDATQKTPPVLSFAGITMQALPQSQILIPSLIAHVSDEDPQSVAFYLIENSQPDILTCSIEENDRLVCTALANMNASVLLTIEAFDGSLSASENIAVTVLESVAECGNGVLEGGEQCDDGNADENDGCSDICMIEVCGDGFAQDDEECDDNNYNIDDQCNNQCERTSCGDSIIQMPNGFGDTEQCDDGNNNNHDGCDEDCKWEDEEENCGDGTLEQGEQCDDGNVNSNDGCRADCKLNVCMDGYRNMAAEQCDDGNGNNQDTCSNYCQLTYCGNGVQESPNSDGQYEGCDDGNNVDTDGCANACSVGLCGNGVVDHSGGENCDDGNNNNNDGCSSVCWPEFCADGIIQSNEGCDDANTVSNDGCSSTCLIEFCGDGICNFIETCFSCAEDCSECNNNNNI